MRLLDQRIFASAGPVEELSNSYSTSDEESAWPTINKKAKFAGLFKCKCSFSQDWKKVWPFVLAVPESTHISLQCMLEELKLHTPRRWDVKKHSATKTH